MRIDPIPGESPLANECFADFVAGGFRTAAELYDSYAAGTTKPKAAKRTLQEWFTIYRWEERRRDVVAEMTSDKLALRKDIELAVLEAERENVGALQALFVRFIEQINERIDEGKLRVTPNDVIKLAEVLSNLGRRAAGLPTTVTQAHNTLTFFKGWESEFATRPEDEQLKYLKALAESTLVIGGEKSEEVVDATFISEDEEII